MLEQRLVQITRGVASAEVVIAHCRYTTLAQVLGKQEVRAVVLHVFAEQRLYHEYRDPDRLRCGR